MAFLAELWLPILVAAVLIFVVSSLIHMVLGFHNNDVKKLPDEDALLSALRDHGVGPGAYVFPCPDDMGDMGSEAMQAKYKQGPVGFMTVLPNGAPMSPGHLAAWFGYTVLVGVFVAYLGSLAVAADANYLAVFRITGTIAVLAYAVSELPASIWQGRSVGSTLKFMVDGVVYGLLTAGSFAWLWPSA